MVNNIQDSQIEIIDHKVNTISQNIDKLSLQMEDITKSYHDVKSNQKILTRTIYIAFSLFVSGIGLVKYTASQQIDHFKETDRRLETIIDNLVLRQNITERHDVLIDSLQKRQDNLEKVFTQLVQR